MAKIRRIVGRRPDLSKAVFSSEELATLQSERERGSGKLQDGVSQCRMDGDRLPNARHLHELVQAWKELYKR
jgi:hypothetical protein